MRRTRINGSCVRVVTGVVRDRMGRVRRPAAPAIGFVVSGSTSGSLSFRRAVGVSCVVWFTQAAQSGLRSVCVARFSYSFLKKNSPLLPRVDGYTVLYALTGSTCIVCDVISSMILSDVMGFTSTNTHATRSNARAAHRKLHPESILAPARGWSPRCKDRIPRAHATPLNYTQTNTHTHARPSST
jgi:hypothetical protein